MTTVSIADLHRDLSALLDKVEAGESLLIVSGDRPIAEVKPIPHGIGKARPSGLNKGEFCVPADFDEPLPEELLRQFYGE